MLQIVICFDQFWTLWSLSGQGQWALLRDLLEGAERLRMIETDLDAIQTTQTIQTGAKRRWFRSSQPPALAKVKPRASGRIFLVWDFWPKLSLDRTGCCDWKPSATDDGGSKVGRVGAPVTPVGHGSTTWSMGHDSAKSEEFCWMLIDVDWCWLMLIALMIFPPNISYWHLLTSDIIDIGPHFLQMWGIAATRWCCGALFVAFVQQLGWICPRNEQELSEWWSWNRNIFLFLFISWTPSSSSQELHRECSRR